ncbi:expressed unknown protein [Seminavis robusta]|uniref:Uncharacterized protein n=1 Tax=Seminavis robusta TaxID=568900 RepID=A0A9N8H5Z5_9STRA|nr:expressed unknown protein [Seminavis robusta]|eukprot:Sro129_g061720.1 n/a (442) ;mRNA; r:102144-103469
MISSRSASSSSSRLTLSLSSVSDLESAKTQLQEFRSTDSTGASTSSGKTLVVGVLISDPRLIRNHAAELQSFLRVLNSNDNNKSKSSDLHELRLAIRGVGKPLGRQPQAAETDDSNALSADAVADLLSSLSASTTTIKKLSLELSVSKLQGSLRRLCQTLLDAKSLYRVVLHECHTEQDERHQGMLPLLETLAQCDRLDTLTLEAVDFPVGDITARVLARLVQNNTALTKLEFQNCVNLGDEELLPLLRQLPGSALQHLKLSTGLSMQQPHPGLQWGNPVVTAVAQALRDPACALQSLHMTHTNSTSATTQQHHTAPALVSLLPIVQALQVNTSLIRLHLYQHHSNTLASELVRILSANENMSLRHCNSLGGSRDEFAALAFYTRLNQLQRSKLLHGFESNDNDNNDQLVMSTLLEQSRDHRIVHYLLSNAPSLIVTRLAA